MCKLINLVTDFNFDHQFCESLSSLLKQNPSVASRSQDSLYLCTASRNKEDAGCYGKLNSAESEDLCGYKSA
ncbi:hypothetical protein RJT34_16271 [Clitoria ternatea]|uniref:Uncharacterized protein n=1 Tax=Clitoria ternatea TaxID=43366 RepID=A0AAN9PCQ9_CLITE